MNIIKQPVDSLFLPGGTILGGEWVLIGKDKVELSNFTKFQFYNIDHKPVKAKGFFYVGTHKNMFIVFNKEKLKTYKIEPGHYGWVHKFMKTKVKCQSKDSLMKHISKAAKPGNVFNLITFSMLTELLK